MKTLLLGDVCPTIDTNELFRQKDIKTLFNDVTELFEGNDINMVNLECALTDSENCILKFGPNLKACAETAEVLKSIGVNYVGLSNNHIFDFGKEGALDTLKTLEANGLIYTGFGMDYEDSRKDLVIEKDGEKISVITVCEHEYSYALEDRMGSRPYDEYDTMEDIRKAKATSDRVIVFYHGGKEQCRYPSPRLRKLCQAMAKNGADVVLCQHSHCVGCYEQFEGCHILYGEGNFFFLWEANSGMDGWNDSVAVQYDTKTHEIKFTPLVVTGKGICIAKGDEAKAIMDSFAARNEELANGQWKQGWRNFCLGKKKWYDSIIGNAHNADSTYEQNHNFAHYLDCEAHTDVWRELNQTANMTNEK